MPKFFKNYNKLIKEVCKRPVIYENKRYGGNLIEEAWQKVAKTMGVDVEICKERWQYLRDTFESKHINMTDNQSNEEKKSEGNQWEYYDKMLFLEPYINFSRIEVIEDIKYDFRDWGDFSEVIMSKTMPDSPAVMKEEDPLGDGRILAESRRRKCTMTKPRLYDLSDTTEEENEFADIYVPSKKLRRGKLEKDHSTKKKYSKETSCLIKLFRSRMYRVCYSDVNKQLLQLLMQSEDADQSFLLSLLPAFKRLSAEDSYAAKERMQRVLDDLQVDQNASDEKHSEHSF